MAIPIFPTFRSCHLPWQQIRTSRHPFLGTSSSNFTRSYIIKSGPRSTKGGFSNPMTDPAGAGILMLPSGELT